MADLTAPGAIRYQKMLDAGTPPDQVEGWRQTTQQRMLESGAPPQEIAKYWGITEPDMSSARQLIESNVRRLTPEEHEKVAETPGEMFMAGLGRSVSGLAISGHAPTLIAPEHAGLMSSILQGSGQFIGDIPAMVAGYVGGSAAGGAAGTAVAPGPGTVVGGLVGGGAGAAALPEAMRQVLMDQYAHPNGVKSWKEFWSRAANIAWDTTKAGLEGGIAAPVGGKLGAAALSAGVSKGAAALANVGAQAATATAVGGVLDGHVPDAQDFVSGAAIAVGFHTAGAFVGAGRRFVASKPTEIVAENQRDIYRETGIPPQEISVPADQNVVLNTEVLAPHAADGTRVTPLLDTMQKSEPDPFKEPEALKEGEAPALPPAPAEDNSQPARNERALTIQGGSNDGLPPMLPPEGGAVGPHEPIEPSGEAPLQRSRQMLVEDTLARIGKSEDPGVMASVSKFVAGFQAQLEPGNRLDRATAGPDGRNVKEMGIADMMRQTFASGSRAAQFMEIGTLGFEADPNGGVRMALTSDDSYLKAYRQVKEDGGNADELKAVRLALRDLELAGRGIESGGNLETSRQLLAQPGIMEQYKRGLDTIRRVKDAAIRYMVDSSVFSEAQAKAMMELGQHHIVLRRLIEPNYNPPSPTRGFGVNRSIKRIEGSERQIIDPDVAEMDNLHTMIAMADMNRARGNIIGLIESREPSVDPSQLRLEHMEAMDVDTGERLRQQVLDEEGRPISTNAALAMEPFLAARATAGRNANDFVFYRDGQAELWRAHDQDLADLMRTQPLGEPHGLVKIAQGFAQMARFGITGAIDFPLRSIWHGQIAGAALAERSSAPFHDVVKGFMSAWNKDADYQRWDANGGADVALTDLRKMNLKNLERVWDESGSDGAVFNAFRHPIDALRAGYHMVDAAARVGYMKRVENEGLSTLKAATLSRTAYFDHAEGRAHSWLRTWASTVPFMEIGFKDIEQVVNAFRDRPVITAMKTAAWITTPTVINYALNYLADKDLPLEQRYSELPQWQRDMYWVLPPVNGVRMKIKRPYVIGFLGATMPERFLDWSIKDDPHAFDGFARAIAAQALPPIIPTVISPIAEQWANKSFFTGRPLIKASLEKNSDWMQYNPDTTETAKKIAQYLGPAGVGIADVSPIVLENYARSWGGTLPMTLLRIMEAKFKPPGRPWEIADTPFAGSFFARHPDTGARTIEEFYDAHTKLTASAPDLNLAIKRQNPMEMQVAIQQDAALKGLNGFADAERKMSAVITAIDQDKTMTPDEKRKRTDQIVNGMIQIAKGGLDVIKQIHEEKKLQ